MSLFVSSSDAAQPGWLLTFLRNVSPAQIREMRSNLAKVRLYCVHAKWDAKISFSLHDTCAFHSLKFSDKVLCI